MKETQTFYRKALIKKEVFSDNLIIPLNKRCFVKEEYNSSLILSPLSKNISVKFLLFDLIVVNKLQI